MSAVSPHIGPQIQTYGPYLTFRNADKETHTWNFSALFITTGDEVKNILVKEAEKVVTMIQSKPLHAEEGYLFSRFDFSILRDLKDRKITLATKLGEEYKNVEITIPGIETPLRFAYFSCNGFDDPSNSEKMGGIQPMWRDVNRIHASNPFHVLIGGGDQLYCDQIWKLPTIEAWREISHESKRFKHEFTKEMEHEVNNFYLNHYLEHFNEPEFREAMAMIPTIYSWDDHDIFDGWGSYRPEEANCPVFQGIFSTAKKWYLVFQQQMQINESQALGYFGETGLHTIKEFGDIAILSVDARSERTYDRFVSPVSYNMIFERLNNLKAETKHLIVMLTVPIIYPSFKHVEMLLELANDVNPSEYLRKLFNKSPSPKALGRGTDEVDLLDDLRDHWNHPAHTEERTSLIERLQEIAKNKGIRITFLSGDVHLASQGYFASREETAADNDPNFMPQITSSAIGNIPPTKVLAALMHRQVKKIEEVTPSTIARITSWVAEDKSNKDPFILHRNWVELQVDQAGLIIKLHAEDEKNSEDRTLMTATKVYATAIPNLLKRKPEVADKEASSYNCALI